nr:MAG TPA: hypothetical protein [Caudoviricetes sp.]
MRFATLTLAGRRERLSATRKGAERAIPARPPWHLPAGT